MPRKYGTTGNQQFASAPAVGVAGATYYNTTESQLYVSDGTTWGVVGGSTGPPVEPTGDAVYYAARAQGASTPTASGAITTVPWNLLVASDGIAFAAGVFTVPVTGYYNIEGQVHFSGVAGGSTGRYVHITVNGTSQVVFLNNAGSGIDFHGVPFSATIKANGGDQIAVKAQQTSGSSMNFGGNNLYTWVSVSRVGVPNMYSGDAACTSSLTVSLTATDVAGMTLTVPVAGPSSVFLAVVTFDVQALVAAANSTFIGYLRVGGTARTLQCLYNAGGTTAVARVTVSQTHRVTGLTAGNHVFQAQAGAAGTTGQYRVNGIHSNLNVTQVS